MGNIKKAGVCAGIAVGSVIGGAVSMIGKMTEKKIIDELGENIMDSTILTGEILGEAASGATHIASGALCKNARKIKKGRKELKKAGKQVVGNAVTNVKNVAEQSGEILEGVKEKDKERVKKGFCKLGKMMAVGLLTVGAIKIDEDGEEGGAAEKEPADAKEKNAVCGGDSDSMRIAGGLPAEKDGDGEIEQGETGQNLRVASDGAENCEDSAQDQDQDEASAGADDTPPEIEEELTMETLLNRKPTLEEELERKIRF